ncbi:MAG: hypothetical protein WB786_04840 [Thermoplasmata archaeon]
MAPMPAPGPAARVDDPTIAKSLMSAEGSPAASAIPDEPESSYYGPHEGKESPSWGTIGIVFGVLLAVALVLFFTFYVVPFSHSESGIMTSQTGPIAFTPPNGAAVTVSWQSVSGAPLNCVIYVPPNFAVGYTPTVLYNVTAASGSFSYTSSGVTYELEVDMGLDNGLSASYTVTYTSPMY